MGTPESTERKVILPPAAFVKLLFKLKGGSFIDADDTDIDELLQDIEFPMGDAGKQEKLRSSQEGNVLVQRSVITMTEETGDDCRILLLHRDEHIITTGGSILTSGSPRDPAELVLANKVTIDPAPTTMERMGFALSSPEQTKGINYLFEIYRTRINAAAGISTKKDHGTLVTPAEAFETLQDKPLELAIMQRLMEKAA